MAKKRKPRKPYKGILTVPAPKYDGDAARWKKEVVVPRLRALMNHYGIDQTDDKKWYLLAVRLAFDYVPGIKPPLQRGRKRSEETIAEDCHLFAVCARAEFEKKSVSNAIRRLTISDLYFKGRNPKTLRHRYYLLKDSRSNEAKYMNAYADWLERTYKEVMEHNFAEDGALERKKIVVG